MSLITITPRVIVGPASEPVTKQDCRDALRIDTLLDPVETLAQDRLLDRFIATARHWFEARTASTLHEQTLEIALASWPCGTRIELPRATPLIAINSVTLVDSDGVSSVWSSAEYIADTYSMPGALALGYNESWPSFTAYPVAPIRIIYRAGIETSPSLDVDEDAKTAILLLIGGLWENRENEVISDRQGAQTIALKYGVEAFVQRHIKTYVF